MTAALFIQNLRKSYGSFQAVRGISFDVAAGEVFGLLGPNGAGKTTTLECILGLRRPDSGTIEIACIDALAQPAKIRAVIGAQHQSTALQDKITPRQALRFFGSFYARPAEAEKLIAQFNLAEKADAPFGTLSGGQRQRLAIALALVNEPPILFLDEPTAGLDAQSRRELHELIASLKVAGRTIVLTTHYIEEAERLCSRVAIINSGSIAAIGSPGDLIATAKSLPRVVVATARPLTHAQTADLEGGAGAELRDGRWHLSTQAVPRTILSLVHLAEAERNEILDLQIHRPTLEDVFLELTGTRITDRQG